MENKSNSLNRIKRHQREKVLRFSIRKYSFGAASVAVAALMFLGARVASADTVSGSGSQSTAGVVQPNDKGDSPVGIKEPTENKSEVVNNALENKETALVENSSNTVDKSQLRTVVEELNSLLSTKLNLDDSVLSSVKERVQRAQALLDKADAVQKDINELKELLSADLVTLSNAVKESSEVRESNTGTEAEKPVSQSSSEARASEENQTVSAKKDALKVSVDQLKVAISEVPEHDTTKAVLEKANELLGLAQGVLQNTTVSLTDVEQMNKLVKRMFTSVKNATTRLSSGSHDPRNGQRMAQGTQFRADVGRVEGALNDVKEYISVDKFDGGGTITGARERTIDKTFMTAKYSTEGNRKYITYDVYFQNDGKALTGYNGNSFWFYPPRDLLYEGSYPVGVVSELYYERYRNHAGRGRLSDNPENFTREGDRYTVPLERLASNGFQDSGSQNKWGAAGGLFQMSGGPTSGNSTQLQQMLKELKDNPELNRIVRQDNGQLPRASYSHLLTVGSHQDYAYKLHIKVRLKDNVTPEQAQKAGTMAVTAKEGRAFNALQAYIYAARGTRLVSKPAAPTITTETRYHGTLVSTDRRISGTGIAGATIKVALQDGKTGTTTVDNNGRWTYNLKENEKLTQNTKQDASIKASNAVSVTQTKDGSESDPATVNVQLAKAISIDTPVQAGRELAVKVAHDTGRFYLQVLNGNKTVYEYAVKQQNGNWVLEKASDSTSTDLIVSNGDNVSEKKITLRIKDSHKKTNFPFKITGDNVVRVRAHHVNGKNNPADPTNDGGWVVAAKATNTNPTITINNPRATYVADGTLTKDKLKTLVTVTDPEDDADKTVGSRAKDNLDVTATKKGKNVDLTKPLKQGTYNLTYRTTDAAGATVTKEHTIKVSYTAQAKPTINLVQGETVSDELKRSLVQLRDGNDVIDVPRDARVEVAVDTSSKTNQNKQAQATVVLADGTRLAPVTLSYRVLPTFPIARTVYDFKNVSRSDDESKYYLNTGIPGGMKWFAKRGNEAEIDASGLRDKINADPVGETTYKFGGKYNYGRFTDRPQPTEKLEHSATFTHKVFDIKPNDTKVTVAQGATLSEAQASASVAKVPGSPDLPAGTTYEWVDARGNKITPTASTAGVQTFKVKVTLPPAQSGNDAPEATKRQPFKIIDVPVNVAPSAPTITTETRYHGSLVSTDRRISGTGIAGATIKVALQDGKTGTTTVDNNGRWTYNLKDNEKLTQNAKQDASIKASKAISVTQTKDGVESPASRVDVQLAKAISIDTPVQAGRELAVKVAHDTGLFYLQVLNGSKTVYEYAVKQQNGNWVLEKGSDTTDLTVFNGDNVSEKKLTLRIKDSHKNTNFPFKITGDNVVRVRAHHVNGKNNPADPTNDGGWVVAAKATNTNPTITINNPRATYVADGTLTKDKLKTLVTVTDAEDDADKTVGSRAKDNLDVTATKGGKNVDLSQPLKQGTYNLTYRTTDAAGATVTKEHTITVNYTAVAKPTINLIQGETVSDELKRSLLQLQDGTSKIDVPNNARVEVTLDTSSPSDNKTAKATVVFADNTRTTPIDINYKVYKNFETVTKVYDFAGVGRNDSPSSYYLNPGGLPGGMSWVVKRDNDAEFKNADAEMKKMLNADGVGTTAYKFGAKYPRGRFTDRPSEAEKLSHTPTFTHEVFDVGANTTRVMVKSGTALADSQAKDAVMAVNGSKALPEGTTYEWVNQNGTPLANKTVTEKGEATRYVKVTLPKVSETGPNANKVQSSKIVTVTINESEKPKVSFNGSELSKDASNENSKFVIFRGATFDPTFTVSDNSGKVTEVKASGLPSGREFVKNTDTLNGNVQITGNDITATSNAALGDHIGKVLVKDASGNEQEYQFKYTVADVEVKNTPETVALGTKLVDTANSSNGKNAHDYVKAVVESNSTGNDKYYPTNMSFKWSKNDSIVSTTTTFDTPGIVKYKAVANFFNGGGTYTKNVEGVGNNIKIYAPNKIEREVTFKVQPTAPTVSQWKNGNLKVTPTTDHDKVTIPLKDGSVTLVKKATGWEVETPKEGVIVRGNSVEIPKDLLGTTITAKGTKGTGDSAVDSENAPSYTLLSHTVNKADIIKKSTDTITATDLSGRTGVTGVTDNNVNKAYANAGITSVGFANGTPTLTPDSEQNVPVTITYNDGSKETVNVTLKVAPAAPNVTVNKQNGKTGDVTLTIKRHDNSNYPDDSVVTVPGIDGTFKVKDGTITIKNNQLKDTIQTGKVTVTERTKLPAETSDDKQIPAKLVESSVPTVTKEGQDGNTGEVTYKVTTPTGDKYPNGSKVTINGKEYTVDDEGKVKVPNSDLPATTIPASPTKAQETGKLPKDGNTVEVPAKLVESSVPTVTKEGQDGNTGEVTYKVTTPTGDKYPNGSKVTINGKEYTVDDEGKVKVPNSDLPATTIPASPTKAQETGKLPKDGNTVEVPAKLVESSVPLVESSVPTVTKEGQDGNTGEVTYKVTTPTGDKYPNGSKVTINGKEYTVDDEGKVKVPNSDLPATTIPASPTKAQETGKLPKDGNTVEVPAKLVESSVPTVTKEGQDGNTGEVTYKVTTPTGDKYPNGSKVTINGKEYTVDDEGKVKVPNSDLPATTIPASPTKAQETGKLPKDGNTVEVPAKLVESSVPTVTKEGQDGNTGEVTYKVTTPTGDKYPNGSKVTINGKEYTVDDEGKVKVPNSDLPATTIPASPTKAQETGKLPKDGNTVEVPAKLVESSVPTVTKEGQDGNTGEVTYKVTTPTGDKYPNGSKVTINGKEYTVDDEGKVKVPNSDLPATTIPASPTKAQETGKLPKDGNTVEVPAKLVESSVPLVESSVPTVTKEGQDGNTGEVTYKVTTPTGDKYPNGSKVTINGKEYTVDDEGKVKVPNSDLPATTIPASPTKAQETGKLPKDGNTVEVPAKLVESSVPTVTKEGQDGNTGEVTYKVTTPTGDKYPNGSKVTINGKEYTVDDEGKVKVPNSDLPATTIPASPTKAQETGKLPKDGNTVEVPAKLVESSVPTVTKEGQDGNTGEVTYKVTTPTGDKYPNGSKVTINGKEYTVDDEGKVKVPNSDLPATTIPASPTKAQETGKLPKDGNTVEVPAKLVESSVPTVTKEGQDGNTGEVTYKVTTPTGDKYPNGSKVTINGKEYTVDDEGKVKVPNSDLPATTIPASPTKAQETGKLPKDGNTVEVPAKLVESSVPLVESSVPTVTKEGQDGNTGEVTYKVTTPTGDKYPNGSKVTINGKEYTVDDEGKVKVPNSDLPATTIPASPTKAQETGKLPKDGNTVEVPAKLVESSVPTVTKEGQDGNTGEVTYKVTTPTGDKYPNGSKVTINGKEYTVDDEGKVKVPNSDLPATTIPASPTKAQETGKLPKDGNTVEVPAKLVESSVPTVTKEGQDGNTGEVTYKVTTPTGDKYPNGSKVTINGKEYTVDDEGKVKVPNSDLPATTIPASPTKAQETGKLPKDGNTVEVPAKLVESSVPLVESSVPTVTKEGQDGNTGEVTYKVTTPTGDKYPNGSKVTINGKEYTVDDEGKVKVPNSDLPATTIPASPTKAQETGKLPKDGNTVEVPAKLVESSVPTVTKEGQDGNTGEVTYKVTTPTGDKYPNGSKVTINGKEYTVDDEGKVKVPNSDLPATTIPASPTKAQETGKLPKDGNTVEVPAKLVESSVPTVTKEGQDGNTGEVTYKVTTPTGDKYPNGSKVTINGKEYTVDDEGKVKVPNSDLPATTIPASPTKAQETGKLPKDGNTVEVPAKLVESSVPTVTKEGQDGNTGEVTYKVTTPTGDKYPNGSKVTINGKEYTVDDEGKVKVPNSDLPATTIPASPTKAQETGKLPKDGNTVEVPAKLVESSVPLVESSVPTVTKEGQDGNTGEVTYKVTTPTGDKYPNGSKVTINGKEYTVDDEGKVKVPNSDLPATTIPASPTKAQETGKLPKDGNTVEVPARLTSSNGEPEVQTETPEYTGPISSNGVDGNGNLIDPPTVELPEFNGGVNGELPDPVELPKVKLIITKWIDEQGNELKPADAKAPAVLGEANEALEAGEIAGYVFVRTDVNEEGDVVTHVFRKVTPTKPEGNGEQQGGDNTPQPTPEVPTDNTERKPETEKPTVPDTKQAEQPTQTVDAQVAPSQNQAVLPNTGTKADRATGALGALSLLGAFGLLFAKKKKDDEEETRNN